MKYLVLATILIAVSGASAQTPRQDYPSCDLKGQKTFKGETGGNIKDPLQAHVSMRGNILQADIGTARKARLLTERQADGLWRRVEKIRSETDGFVAAQGFLSAAERASFDREFDAIAAAICR